MISRWALIFVTTISVAASAQLACPPGFEAGRSLGQGFTQLTGAQRKIGDEVYDSPADPSPPFTESDGRISVFGSSLLSIRYRTRDDFENAGCFERVAVDLRQENGAPYSAPDSEPWDLRKFHVIPAQGRAYDIIVGGAMSRVVPNASPLWPDDNVSRRIFIYRESADGSWLRDPQPIVGRSDHHWLGHSYGGNFFQTGESDPNILDLRGPGAVAFFYDQVSDDSNDSPFKTEIFAARMTPELTAQSTAPIVAINSPPFPSFRRTIGGYLAEGPRPVEMKIGGSTFFVVTFSTGDFPTDSYAMNYAWSRSLAGPYQLALNDDQTDLRDLGAGLKIAYHLSCMGRAAIFRSPRGGYEMLFHAADKTLFPAIDFSKWPSDPFFRSIYKITVDAHVNARGEPVLTLNPQRAAAEEVSSSRKNSDGRQRSIGSRTKSSGRS